MNDDYYKINIFMNFAEDLYKNQLIDYKLERKLKKLIKEKNEEILSILNSYLYLKSKNNIDDLTQKIKPSITLNTENIEEFKQKSSSLSDEIIKKGKKPKKFKKNIKMNDSLKIKVELSKEEKILDDLKINFSKDKYIILKKLLENKEKKIINIIKSFEKNNDYNLLLSKLSRLVSNFIENNSENAEIKKENLPSNENDSSYDIKIEENQNSNFDKKTNNSILDNKEIKKISKKIINSLKNAEKHLYYITKYDLQKLKNDKKISLFLYKFKLNLDELNKDNYKIPKKSVSLIKNYYKEYIQKKICNKFNDNEKLIYEHLLEEENEENNIILYYFKDLLNHQNLKELKYNIRNTIKEVEEILIKEKNAEIKEDERENEEIKEVEEEGEEESEEDEKKEGKEKEKICEKNESENYSNKKNYILNDRNKDKDKIIDILNNNYRKINSFSNLINYNNNSNNNKDDKNNEENEKKEKDNIKYFGLEFVAVEQKNINKEEGKNNSNNNNKIETINRNKLYSTISIEKESTQSTNKLNKKLNIFITQIEHLKKIDNIIKKTLIESIHSNNKYIMELFQKFQKNKFSLNPKSLNDVYKQIIDNSDKDSKNYLFKSLIKEIPNVNENNREFLFNEFTINKNSELESFYSLYELNKEKNEFFENIKKFMNKPEIRKNIIKYSLNKIKSEINTNLFETKEIANNKDLINKSKEIVIIFLKYNLFNEKEYNIIMKLLKNEDDLFTAIFQVLFEDQDLNEFYETISMALDNM